MDYERRYKEALERAKELCDVADTFTVTIHDIITIFPELNPEREDERIRKEILNVFKQLNEGTTICGRNYDYAKWIAWLEKQGEKPTDKIEPTPAWSKEDEEMLKWLCRIIHSQRVSKAITLKEESELGEWMDKWLNHNPQPKQCEHLENYDEDERVRKWLEELIEAMPDNSIEFKELKRIDVLHWLEKQGKQETLCDKCKKEHPSHSCQDITELGRCAVEHEQKPTDKVEPKFKVGDWIVKGDTIAQILDIQKQYYVGIDINGKDFTLSKFLNDAEIHLWSIQDAKDGDVLVDEDNNIGIYSGEKDDLDWHSCIYLGCDGCLRGFSIGGYHKHKNTKPATKEQRDLLFQKIAEAGYEWDAEKKELNKIEPKKLDINKMIEWLKPYSVVVDNIIDEFKKDFGL